MTKADLIKQMAKKASISQKAAASALNAFVGAIHDSLKKKGGKVRVWDLGTFFAAHRKARMGINPQNNKKIHIPATNVPRFKAARALQRAVKAAK